MFHHFSISSNYERYRSQLKASMERLATGDQFVKPGVGSPADLTLSERLRFQIKGSKSSEMNIQAGISFLSTVDMHLRGISDILNRMTELSVSATDSLKGNEEREILQSEFFALQNELSRTARQADFNGRQTLSREGLVFFDQQQGELNIVQANGEEVGEVKIDFSSSATDAHGKAIEFDPQEDFIMNREGTSLFFISQTTRAIHRYDIEFGTVSKSSELFSSQDKLFLDEFDQLYINQSGTLYEIDSGGLQKSATNISDMASGTNFSVYNQQAVYQNTAGDLVKKDLNTGSTETLLSGSSLASHHSLSASGQYLAEEIADGTIRVTDLNSGNSTSYTIDAADADSVQHLELSEEGDRLYFINGTRKAVSYLNISSNSSHTPFASFGGDVVSSGFQNDWVGLSAGGGELCVNCPFCRAKGNGTVFFL